MRNLLLIISMLTMLVVLAGCSGSDVTDVNQNANATSGPVQEYTDANLALADGTRFLDTGETEKAIDALNQAVKLNADLGEAWFKLGIAYSLAEFRDQTLETANTNEQSNERNEREKRNSEIAFERAVKAYKKAIENNAEDHAAHYDLGRAYNKLNDDQDAAKALRQAVKLKPDDTEYQTELGAILIKLAQYHEAIAPLKKALELDPENIRAQQLLEDAEAGRKRVSYSSTPKEDKKPGSTNSNANSNSASDDGKPPPPPSPEPGPPKPRPTPTRPPG